MNTHVATQSLNSKIAALKHDKNHHHNDINVLRIFSFARAVKNVNNHYESSPRSVGKKDIYACIINIQMNAENFMKAV